MRKLITLLAVLVGWPALASAQTVDYYHLDSVGNVLAVTDSAGLVVEQHDYYPFGEECTTAPCVPIQGNQPKRFTGKERDAETGLDYLGARYYGSKIGRFTTTDPFLDQRAALVDPQRWNRYAYGRNNPLRYVDPDGKDIIDYFTGAANAFGSNFAFGGGRVSGGNADFQFGQFVGDVFSIPAGTAWAQTGAGVGGLGILGAPETGGATLVATGAGVVMFVEGGTATAIGAANAGIYFSKRVGDWSASTKNEIDAANAERHGGSNACENCGRSVEKVGNKKGVPTPDNQLQRHHKEPLREGQPPGKRGPSTRENAEVLCPGCHQERHQ